MAYSLGFPLQINKYCVSNPWPLTDSFLYGKHTRAETPDGEGRGECGGHTWTWPPAWNRGPRCWVRTPEAVGAESEEMLIIVMTVK